MIRFTGKANGCMIFYLMAGESDDIFCVSNFRFKNDQVIYLFNSFSYSTVFFFEKTELLI